MITMLLAVTGSIGVSSESRLWCLGHPTSEYPPPALSTSTPPGPNRNTPFWLDPSRIARFFTARSSPGPSANPPSWTPPGNSRALPVAGTAPTAYPMRTYICDRAGVVKEDVLDWSCVVVPAPVAERDER